MRTLEEKIIKSGKERFNEILISAKRKKENLEIINRIYFDDWDYINEYYLSDIRKEYAKSTGKYFSQLSIRKKDDLVKSYVWLYINTINVKIIEYRKDKK